MLTRQVYRNIAQTFRIALEHADDEQSVAEQLAWAARTVAIDLKEDNRRFRFDLFFEACGLDEFGEVKA